MAASRAISDRTIKDILDALIAKWTAEGFTCEIQLFETNVAVSNASVLGDFTVATWAGGGSLNVNFATFGAAVVAGHVATVTDSTVYTWTNTGVVAGTAWGYLVWDDDASELLFAENFGAAVTIAVGGSESVIPVIKERSADF